MFNEETLTKLNKLSEMCESSIDTLTDHYYDLKEEINNIYVEIDNILHSKKSDDNRKKANIVFTGEDWRLDTYDRKNELVGTTTFNTLIGHPTSYVDVDIIGMIEGLILQDYEITFEYKIKGE